MSKTANATATAPAPKTEPVGVGVGVAVHTIRATAVYSRDSARRALGLRKSTISREIRERRLRVSMRAGRYFILGKWILEWIEAGERTKTQTQTQSGDQ